MPFLLALLLFHLLFAAIAQYRIYKTTIISNRLKLVNSCLAWVIPFLWSISVIINFRPEKFNVVTRDMRKEQASQLSDDWMGITGGGE